MELLMANVKDKDRVLRHFRWRSTEFLIGRGSAHSARLIWTALLLGLGVIAYWAGSRGSTLPNASYLWMLAMGGFGIWLYNVLYNRPALGWTGYYVAWIALSGIIMSAPHLVNVGRSFLALGAVLAVLDLPSPTGFLAMATGGVVVGLLVETRFLAVIPEFKAVGFGFLAYLGVPLALHLNLGLLEKLYANGFADDLTSTGNRKLLRWLQASLWPPIEREGRSMSLLLLDLDNFKVVNDTLGHVAGDRMLRRLAKVIESEIRHDDIVCRYGGDEFVVLLLDSSVQEAVAVAERLRRRICEVSRQEFANYPITVSIGVANYPKHAEDVKELLEEADQALIREAKLRGRNRVATAFQVECPENWVEAKSRLPRRVKDLLEIVCLCAEGTMEHTNRVAELSYRLAEALGLPESARTTVVQAAALHDAGKIVISKKVLEGATPLSQEEQELLRLHPTLGAAILANLDTEESIVDAVHYQYEWWDGTGYPYGLSEDQIPIEAAILAVVDAYDELTNPRIRGMSLTPKEAMAEIAYYSGIRFNPIVVDKLQEIVSATVYAMHH